MPAPPSHPTRPAPAVLAALRDLRDRLAARYGDRLTDVRLFGSHARGEAHAESDVDVLVVIRGMESAELGPTADIGTDVYQEHGVPLSLLPLSDDEWQRLVDRELLLAEDIRRDGIPV